MSFDPVGYTFLDGSVICANCCTDETDEGNETGQACAVFYWDDAALELVCDECELVLLESAGYVL